MGRARTINMDDCTIITPLDCNIPENPSKTVPTVASGRDAPSSYTPQLFNYGLGQLIHKTLSSGAAKPHVKDYNVVKTLHDQVVSLLNALPPVMRPENPDTSWDSRCPNLPKQRQQIFSFANSFLMALHRPHVGAHSASRQAAVQAALNTLESQQRLFDMMSRHHYKLYSLSCLTIDAGVFLSAMAIEHPPMNYDVLGQTQRALQQAIGRLSLMQERSAMARSGVQVFMHCYRMIRERFQTVNGLVNREASVVSPVQLGEAEQVNHLSEGDLTNKPQFSVCYFQPTPYDSGSASTAPIHQPASSDVFPYPSDLNTIVWLEPLACSADTSLDTSLDASFWMEPLSPNVDADVDAPAGHSIWDPLLGYGPD